MGGYSYAPDRKRTILRTSAEATKILLERLYIEGTPLERMRQRNEEIRHQLAKDMSKMEIAQYFGLSTRRVGQILNDSNL